MFDSGETGRKKEGSLREQPLLQLLHESSIERRSGRLRIDLDEMRLEIRLAKGEIEDLSSGFVRGLDLLSLLEAEGLLGRQARKAAIEHLAKGSSRVGGTLVAEGHLSEEELWRILEEQAQIKLARALPEREGIFRFEEEGENEGGTEGWNAHAIVLRAIEGGMSPGQLRRMIQPFERSIVAQTASFTIRPSLAWKEVEERFLEAARGPIAVASLLRRSDFELARSRRYQILLYLYATGQVHFKSPPLPQRHGASPPARLLRRTTKKRMTTVDPLVGGKKRFSREEVIALARKGSALEDADLSGLDLSGLDLSGAHLAGVNLHKANLRNTRLCRANLMRANLSGANLYNTDLSQANLSRAIFHQAHLVKTKLDGANLEKAVFEDLRTWLGH